MPQTLTQGLLIKIKIQQEFLFPDDTRNNKPNQITNWSLKYEKRCELGTIPHKTYYMSILGFPVRSSPSKQGLPLLVFLFFF